MSYTLRLRPEAARGRGLRKDFHTSTHDIHDDAVYDKQRKNHHHCRHYPDQYEICIKAVQDDEWITATYYVTEEVYSTVDVGDYFRYEKDRDRTQPVYYDEKGGKTDEQ